MAALVCCSGVILARGRTSTCGLEHQSAPVTKSPGACEQAAPKVGKKDKSGKKAKWANSGAVEGAAIVTAKAPPVGKSLSLGILQDTLDLP